MRHARTFGLTFLAVSGLAACSSPTLGNNLPGNGSAATQVGGAPSASSSDALTAQQGAQSADDAAGTDSGVAGSASTSRALELLLSAPAQFSTTVDAMGGRAILSGDEQATVGGWTLNANIDFTSNPNARRGVSGSETLVVTWANPNEPNRTLVVDANIIETLADKDTVSITSLDANNPTFDLSAVGRPADGNVLLTASLNEHRVRRTQDGNLIFDMNITTDPNAPLAVTNAYANNVLTSRTLTSGILIIHHNLAKFTGTHTFTNVQRDVTGTCLCPQSGSITQVVSADSGKGTYTRVYTFTGCGTANVVTSGSTLTGTANGSATVTWNDCSN